MGAVPTPSMIKGLSRRPSQAAAGVAIASLLLATQRQLGVAHPLICSPPPHGSTTREASLNKTIAVRLAPIPDWIIH